MYASRYIARQQLGVLRDSLVKVSGPCDPTEEKLPKVAAERGLDASIDIGLGGNVPLGMALFIVYDIMHTCRHITYTRFVSHLRGRGEGASVGAMRLQTSVGSCA